MAKKEGTTKSFILRVDSTTLDAIEAWAADEFRSVNGQIQWILAEALKKSGRMKNKNSKTLSDSTTRTQPDSQTDTSTIDHTQTPS